MGCVKLRRGPFRVPVWFLRRQADPEEGKLETEVAALGRVQVARIVPPLDAILRMRPVVFGKGERPRAKNASKARTVASQRL